MSEPNDQDMTHPLEQVTGERDVPPEEDSGRTGDEETAAGAEDTDAADESLPPEDAP
ncbi:hypothetical protein [Streptomyces sp.]|uniref:hypothetical protein n=1 Tax=Streptomyces sp. TaxID=1931 RepID=UPI002D2E69C5|nr:hypothetical protein [Streptomyces sp.]HZF87836.1 hypothetical protein [Streptomyces sp.]